LGGKIDTQSHGKNIGSKNMKKKKLKRKNWQKKIIMKKIGTKIQRVQTKEVEHLKLLKKNGHKN